MALAVLSGVAPTPDAGADRPPPRLVIEAGEPQLAPSAARLQRIDPGHLDRVTDLVGLGDPGPPIHIRLVAEDSAVARETPPWISGYAYGNLGQVVIFPGRAPAYPDGSLEEILLHEVAHVLIARAAGGREVPRWFNEGLAMYAGDDAWGLADRYRLSWSMLIDRRVPLAGLADRFAGGSGEAGRAYAVSGAFVRDLLDHRGRATAALILTGVARGLPFDEAFRRAAGTTLARAEDSFWRRYSFWYRWVPVLTSSTTLWIAITLLALAAIRRRRARDAAMRAAWEREEWLASFDDEPVN